MTIFLAEPESKTKSGLRIKSRLATGILLLGSKFRFTVIAYLLIQIYEVFFDKNTRVSDQ